ncbi:MAG: SDR family NAD(P)-dependent oxidoreductase [Candidatus Kapabacteria bacterium]|nr:SDR family NAD(P)-dependent oxidoreductase [Candidatus Kapabacteria bacterium]MDW8012690.1 SDR family NAD(P)-dependent oxidoreductase [Bacteroidota bacterium]
MPTYVVTGCAGFIGWKTSERLLQQGATVVGIDNLNDAYDPRLKLWRLRRLQEYTGFHFLRADITDLGAIQPILQRFQPEAVINLAARAGVRYSLQDPWSYYATNLTGTLNLLELCRRLGISKFVLASTSSVYGAGTPPFREEDATEHPRSPYAASKRAAELLCATYHELYGLDITVLRYFTVYGPAGRPDMSLFIFTEHLLRGEPLEIFGDGQQQRDFTYVDDIAEGTIHALRPLGYAVINLGNRQPIRLLDAVRTLEYLLERRAQLLFRPAHPADVPTTEANIDRARALLGWEPSTPFSEGIRHMVAWHLQHRHEIEQLTLESP